MAYEDAVFGKFVIKRRLQKGGMAWVYLAEQESIGRPVAVKILFPNLAEEEKIALRFELEARIAGRLQHENIVQVIDYGRHNDQPYIVLEFIDGVDLGQWLGQHGPLPLEIALLILRDVCRALEYAHAPVPGRNIVHRDLKPSNIMFSREGAVKLMDFGLARALAEDITRTRTGAVLGTVPYMSPEQSIGEVPDGQAGKLSDIFSMGIVCYELLGGERPFRGEPSSAISRAIQTFEPPIVSTLNPLVPEAIVEIVRRMLAKVPQQRVQEIGQVVRALEAAVVQLGITHDRAQLKEFAQDPAGVTERLRREGLSRHLERGLHFETLGHGHAEAAAAEYRRALFLDPANPLATEKLGKIERREASGRRMNPPPAPPEPDVETEPILVPSDDETGTREHLHGRPPALWPVVGLVALLVVAYFAWRNWPFFPPRDPNGSDSPVGAGSTALHDSVRVDTTSHRDSTHQAPPKQELRALQVTTIPARAKVAVDHGPNVRAPHTFSGLTAGRHTVSASARGFETLENVPVDLTAEDKSLPLTLRRQTGVVAPVDVHQQPKKGDDVPPPKVVTSTPARLCWVKVVSTNDFWGIVCVDGKDRGVQTGQRFQLAEGTHTIGVHRPDSQTCEKSEKRTFEAGTDYEIPIDVPGDQ